MRHSAELSVETCVLQYSTRSSWAAAAALVELSVLWYGIVYLSRTTDGRSSQWMELDGKNPPGGIGRWRPWADRSVVRRYTYSGFRSHKQQARWRQQQQYKWARRPLRGSHHYHRWTSTSTPVLLFVPATYPGPYDLSRKRTFCYVFRIFTNRNYTWFCFHKFAVLLITTIGLMTSEANLCRYWQKMTPIVSIREISLCPLRLRKVCLISIQSLSNFIQTK